MKVLFVILFLIISANFIFGSPRKNPSKKRKEHRKDSAEEELRIIGGEDAEIESYPYIVSLVSRRVEGDKTITNYCAGSIIKENYILTAAHCLRDSITADILTVRTGSNFKDNGGSAYEAEKFIRHEDWITVNGTEMNDVAVIKLKDSIVFSETSQPIELFEANETVQADSRALILGWGNTQNVNPKEIYDGQLQETTVPVVNQTVCEEIYKSDNLLPGYFCAGYLEEGGKDTCGGDSGGPVVIDGRQAGIVSWGKGCAEPGLPGLYTDVGYFRDWIDEQIEYLNQF